MSVKTTIVSIVLLILFCSCLEHNRKVNQVPEQTNSYPCAKSIEGMIGIVKPNDSIFQFGDSVHIYDNNNEVVDTLAIHEEYQDFALYCLSQEGNYYNIKWNDSSMVFLKKSKKLELVSWEKYLINSLVEFDAEENPIRKKRSSKSDALPFDANEFYRIIEVNGDWVKIDWGSPNQKNSGWIKWRNGNCLIIELPSFS